MPKLDQQALSQGVDAIRQMAQEALQNQSAEDMERVEHQIGRLSTLVREAQQALWSADVKMAIRRLEHNEPLGEADLDVIRTFLVSDAEHYLAVENNFEDWRAEFERLLGEVATRVRELDRNSIAELRGVLADLTRLTPDVRNYFDEQNRVRIFEQSMKSLDPETRQTLARLLRDQVNLATA
ncbi:MAG: hypothetical protein AB7Q17_00440 [Phycisphaerae bacterium]